MSDRGSERGALLEVVAEQVATQPAVAAELFERASEIHEASDCAECVSRGKPCVQARLLDRVSRLLRRSAKNADRYAAWKADGATEASERRPVSTDAD